ncbi:hypothetical protein M885DRAFT_516433 [Pelagophyceae sp. CCMP2097]|nr:hypothetical protein M885DRAFT_516433 [Pelagophyceae sp. CCMP2097]
MLRFQVRAFTFERNDLATKASSSRGILSSEPCGSGASMACHEAFKEVRWPSERLPLEGTCVTLTGKSGRTIALGRTQGRYFALDARCHHMGELLCKGGDATFAIEDGVVTCPHHGRRIRVADGAEVRADGAVVAGQQRVFATRSDASDGSVRILVTEADDSFASDRYLPGARGAAPGLEPVRLGQSPVGRAQAARAAVARANVVTPTATSLDDDGARARVHLSVAESAPGAAPSTKRRLVYDDDDSDDDRNVAPRSAAVSMDED